VENRKNHYRLTFIEKRELALHIVTQYFRLPQIGDSMVDTYIRMKRAEIDIVKEIMVVHTGNAEFRNLKYRCCMRKASIACKHIIS